MEPIKLQPFEITREMFVPFAFRYKLAYSLTRLALALLVLALGSFLIHPYAPIGVLVGGAALMVLLVGARRGAVDRVYDSPMNRAAFERRHVEFDDLELRVTSERNARSFVPFSCLAKIEEYDDRFLIFITGSLSWMLPKTAFPDIQAMAEFREVARRNNLLQ